MIKTIDRFQEKAKGVFLDIDQKIDHFFFAQVIPATYCRLH